MKLKLKFKFRRKRRGFTILEALVTISIMVLVSGIGIVSYNGAQNKAKLSVDYSTGASIATAVQMALADNANASSIDMEYLTDNGYLLSTPVSKSKPNETFSVSITGNNITVKLGDETVYPNSNISESGLVQEP